jgi:hypothetical protein
VAEARTALLSVLCRAPELFGLRRSRWRLTDLLRQCDWLSLHSEAGLSKYLRRLDIHYKRARD